MIYPFRLWQAVLLAGQICLPASVRTRSIDDCYIDHRSEKHIILISDCSAIPLRFFLSSFNGCSWLFSEPIVCWVHAWVSLRNVLVVRNNALKISWNLIERRFYERPSEWQFLLHFGYLLATFWGLHSWTRFNRKNEPENSFWFPGFQEVCSRSV